MTTIVILGLWPWTPTTDSGTKLWFLWKGSSLVSKLSVHGKYSKPMGLKFSIPQGSCSGANIFTCYCSLINESVPLSVTLTGFADDHSIRKSTPAKCQTSEENSVTNNNHWLDDINPSQAQQWQNGIHNVWLQANAETWKHISPGLQQQSYTTK